MCTEHHYWNHDYVRLAWDSGFCFDLHKSKTNLDWSSIAIVDIEKIIRDRDVAIIEKHLNTVCNYYLEPDHTKVLDPTFVKVFRLSQLSIQYLQFCKRYLDNTVILLKKELAKYREENTQLKDCTDELKSEINELKKKVKTLRESLESQTHSIENTNAFKCPTCLKMFLTEEYLNAHVKRRHEDTTPFQSETDKLQLEIKELKERMNTTEKFIQSDHRLKIEVIPDNNKAITEEKEGHIDLLIAKFDELKLFIEKELNSLKTEKCNDKYERWLEIVFQRLDNSKKELQSEKYGDILSTGDGYNEVRKADNDTQTSKILCKDSEMMTEPVQEKEVKSPVREIDIDKLQQDLFSNTETQLGQMQGVLEQKLTGGLEQIQTQINSFCQTLNKIEVERTLIEHKQFTSPMREPVLAQTVNSLEPTKKEKITDDKIKPKPIPRVTKSLPLVKEKNVVVAKRSAPKLESKPFMKSTRDGLSSETCSYSSMSEDEKALFPQKNSKDDGCIETIPIDNDKSSTIRLETLYDKNINIVTKYENIVSKKGSPDKAPMKPSTSTLGRRSISSLKQVGKDKQVLAGLKNELEEMLYLRLKEVGVSPAWKRLPQKSYVKAMNIIQHQAELSTKKYPNYHKIKEKLLKKINLTLKKNVKKKVTSIKIPPEEKKHNISTSKLRMPVRRSKPPPEPKLAYSSDDDMSSNRSYITAPQEQINTETVENKPSGSLSKKKVFFDIEESSSISKDKQQIKEAHEARQERNFKQKIPTLTMVISKGKADNALVDKIDLFGEAVQAKGHESEGTTESITSSILDFTKMQTNQKEEISGGDVKNQTSDWEISDIY